MFADFLGVLVGGLRAQCVFFRTRVVPWLALSILSSTSPLLMRDGPPCQKSYNTEIFRRTHGTRMLKIPWRTSLSGIFAHHHPNQRRSSTHVDPPSYSFLPRLHTPCTPHTPYQPTVNSTPPHTRPLVVAPLDAPTLPCHSAQDHISPRTEHLLKTVEPSTMRDLVGMGLMCHRFAVHRWGSLQLYLRGECVSRSPFIEPSLERALAIASTIDPNCPLARAPLKGKPPPPDVTVQFEATASQPTLGALLEHRHTSLLPMRPTTNPRVEKRAKAAKSR